MAAAVLWNVEVAISHVEVCQAKLQFNPSVSQSGRIKRKCMSSDEEPINAMSHAWMILQWVEGTFPFKAKVARRVAGGCDTITLDADELIIFPKCLGLTPFDSETSARSSSIHIPISACSSFTVLCAFTAFSLYAP